MASSATMAAFRASTDEPSPGIAHPAIIAAHPTNIATRVMAPPANERSNAESFPGGDRVFMASSCNEHPAVPDRRPGVGRRALVALWVGPPVERSAQGHRAEAGRPARVVSGAGA